MYVGLDYGRKRIGIAVSSPLGTVHPRERLVRTELEQDLRALKELLDETGAVGVVLGLPHHMDGSQSEMETEVRAFGAKLAAVCSLPVLGSDERLTSEAADRVLANQDVHWRKRKDRRDSAAACIVLQDFLQAEEKAERIA